MNTELLKTFISLSNNRSFTKTAQEILVSQSTVSSRIQELEIIVGQKLFIRGKRNVDLTESGRCFLKFALEMINIEELAIRKVNTLASYKYVLNIDVTHTMYDNYIQALTANFVKKFKNTSLKINIAHSSEVITRLSQFVPDIAIILYQFHHPNYICEPFVQDNVVLVTNYDNIEYEKGITKNGLLETPLVYSDFFVNTGFEWLLPSHRIYSFEINIVEKIIPFLIQENWYCFMIEANVSDYIEKKILRKIPLIDINIPKRQSYIIYRSNYENMSHLRQYLKLIRDYMDISI